MLESIYSKCPFLGIACESYDDFKEGHCFDCNNDDSQCVSFGMKSRESFQNLMSAHRVPDVGAPLRVYLMTGAGRPFCRTHFRVTIHISSSKDSLLHGGEIGIFTLVMHSIRNYRAGDADSGKPQLNTDAMKFSPEPLLVIINCHWFFVIQMVYLQNFRTESNVHSGGAR